MIPGYIKDSETLDIFKAKIRKWKPINCPCCLRKKHIPVLGFINQIWFSIFAYNLVAFNVNAKGHFRLLVNATNCNSNSSFRWTVQTCVDNRQPIKVGCWDNPLTLRDFVVSNLHQQQSPIATSKISHCLPQLQISKSKTFFTSYHKFYKPPYPFQGISFFTSSWKIYLLILFILFKQFFKIDISYN